jgi:hypothetical protein
MPVLQQKRTAENAIASAPKKAKLTEVQTKVEEVVTALGSDDFHVAGPNSNRQMLIALASCILETAQDCRHPKQEELAEFFKEVFVAEDARLNGKAQETQAEVDGADAEMTTRKSAVDIANKDVENKASELKERMRTLAADVGVAQSAKSDLDEITSEITLLKEMQEIHVSEQQDVAAKAEIFATFKDGTWEGDAPKDKIKELCSFFRKLKVDSSLVAAMPMALGRKPDERSQFDVLTVTELDSKLTMKQEECASKVKESEVSLEEKAAIKETRESALATAQQKQRAGAEALLQTRAEHKEFISVLAEKNQKVIDGQFENKAMEAELFQRSHAVEVHQKIRSTLTELLERQTPAEVVEPVVPEVPVESVVEEVVAQDSSA